jgi:ribonuclease BN (tRNA processing enzyme)
MRDKPLVIHATDETLAILKKHIFNWEIWPDFAEIPSLHQPILRYESIALGETKDVGGRKLTPLPVNHIVPAVGFQIEYGNTSLVFSGDTTTCDALWEAVNRIRNLKYLIIETAFSNAEKGLAIVSKHLCPSLLAEELRKLRLNPEIYITHLKPGEVELTMQEIGECVQGAVPKMLQNGQVFEF